jgi:SAM-dependent methyltransferase
VQELDPRRARSFGARAEEYERWRPSYPSEAVAWLVPPDAVRVADVGAGTGKLTGPLLALGLEVAAVEPDPAMLAVLRRERPAAVPYLAGADAIDGPRLEGRLRTHSAFAVLPPAERERLIAAMVAVVTAEAERRGTPTVPLRQHAHCARWRPTDG